MLLWRYCGVSGGDHCSVVTVMLSLLVVVAGIVVLMLLVEVVVMVAAELTVVVVMVVAVVYVVYSLVLNLLACFILFLVVGVTLSFCAGVVSFASWR